MTQFSSKQRVKVDTIGSDGMQKLFSDYASKDTISFRSSCIQAILLSSGSVSTKEKFVTILTEAKSKDVMLKKVTNYLLAGQGLGV